MVLFATKKLLPSLLIAGSLLTVPMGHAQHDRHGRFYDGARSGGRGDYYNHGHDYGRYHGHGVGAGTGALIGGAGGAALGAIFGGGLKGAIVGGAAGAGIGAIAGHEHQQTMKRHYYERRSYPR